MRTTLVILALLLHGCFLSQASPTKKLSDAVNDMNNAARWGRVGQAALYVDSTYRQDFVLRRAHWADELQLAESEVVHMQVGNDNETAVAMVSYSWYGYSDMTLHSTVIQQTWKNFDGDFALIEEHVVRGDPKLLKDVEDDDEGEEGDPKGDATDEKVSLYDTMSKS